MNAIDKVIWYIENHSREQISLDTLAELAGVSKYHLSRMFCYSVGQPFSRYVRLRRLSKAAIALSAGETNILDLALSLGYGSHEAFTRAFKQHFNLTPEQVREQGHINNLNLFEAKLIEQDKILKVAEPRQEQLGTLTIAGISRFYSFEKVAEIPDQWQSFAPIIPKVVKERKPTTYGVIYNGGDDSFDYLCGIELPSSADLMGNMMRLNISPQDYLVFWHSGHVANVRGTCDAIWSDWLPASGKSVVEAPWFERYGEKFDPQTGEGGLEIWIPTRS